MSNFKNRPTLSELMKFEEGEGFYLLNLLQGPIIITDRGEGGLYLDPIEGGGVVDLSYEDKSSIMRSAGLRQALQRGYVERITYEEYVEQERLMYEKAQEMESQRVWNKINIDSRNEVIDAEAIDMGGANPRSKQAPERSMYETGLNNPDIFVKAYQRYKDQYGVSREEFATMVEEGRITVDHRGEVERVVRSSRDANRVMDPLEMSRTRPTVGVPMDDGKGGGYIEPSRASLNNTTITLADPRRYDSQEEYVAGDSSFESDAETIDLSESDDDWNRQMQQMPIDEGDGENAFYMGGRKPISRKK